MHNNQFVTTPFGNVYVGSKVIITSDMLRVYNTTATVTFVDELTGEMGGEIHLNRGGGTKNVCFLPDDVTRVLSNTTPCDTKEVSEERGHCFWSGCDYYDTLKSLRGDQHCDQQCDQELIDTQEDEISSFLQDCESLRSSCKEYASLYDGCDEDLCCTNATQKTKRLFISSMI